MTEEEMNLFYELINGFEYVGSLTEEGRLLIKRGVIELKDRLDNAIKYELELSYLADAPIDEERLSILKGGVPDGRPD